MKETYTRSGTHRFWHKMKKIHFENHLIFGYLVSSTGVDYYQCTKCNTRKVVKLHNHYQKIDYDWLYFKRNYFKITTKVD